MIERDSASSVGGRCFDVRDYTINQSRIDQSILLYFVITLFNFERGYMY